MRKAVFVLALIAALPLASPAAASRAEVMPLVEEAHESVLRKIFIKTQEFLDKVNNAEQKRKERQQWESDNAFGLGGRG